MKLFIWYLIVLEDCSRADVNVNHIAKLDNTIPTTQIGLLLVANLENRDAKEANIPDRIALIISFFFEGNLQKSLKIIFNNSFHLKNKFQQVQIKRPNNFLIFFLYKNNDFVSSLG